MSLIEEKNLKVVSFSGKQDRKYWEIKFLGWARCNDGFREILLGTVSIPKNNKKFDLMKPAEKKNHEKSWNSKKWFSPLIQPLEMEGLLSSQSAAARVMSMRMATWQMPGVGAKHGANQARTQLRVPVHKIERCNRRPQFLDLKSWIHPHKTHGHEGKHSWQRFYCPFLNILPKEQSAKCKLEEWLGSMTNLITI